MLTDQRTQPLCPQLMLALKRTKNESTTSPGPERVPETVYLEKIKKIFIFFENFRNFFGWGALPPRPPGFWLGGQSTPRLSLKRSFVTFDRGGQTGPPRANDFFFGAADDTRAAADCPPAVRRPSTGRPTTVHGTNDPTVPGS